MKRFLLLIGILLFGLNPVVNRHIMLPGYTFVSPDQIHKLFLAELSRREPPCPDYCTKEFLLGKINYRKDTVLFTKVEPQYTYNNVYLKKEVYEAFKIMYEAAKKDQVNLIVVSGCRTFNDQQCIWDNKWKREEYMAIPDEKSRALAILSYVAVPGTSRHHWGTEIDFNSAKLAYYSAGKGKKLYEWLKENAPKFGFYQPYTPINEERPTGYQEEMWHWTYLPLSSIFIREYCKQVTPADLDGFEGAKTLQNMEIFRDWVLGINPVCKQLATR
ncbi:M15 family metallopeptidase [Parabacteroides pacaensis]|uniref:M15 family metallopeptidase n=1 Tax=Parabacteroides pacaensis TaxID=2086575 RepID=UPI000D109395|nr:M15 family metallopeptidase [Parabacteroides pacaensis]